MTTEENPQNEPAPPDKGRRPITIDELRRRAICKKRYGRATLTIRRWGGLSGLLADSDLAKKVQGFRVGDLTAEEVAWAFVRARIEGHSPTFNWKQANLERLIELVAECSESPHFEAQTPEELADELVKAQDNEREQLKRLTAQFAESFAGVGNFTKLLQPQLTEWAAQQQKLFASLSRSFVTPALSTSLAAFAVPSVHEQMRSLGLTASVRKAMFPALEPGLARSIATAGIPSQQLLAQRIRLPDTIYGEFSKSLERSLGLYRTQTVTPALEALTRHQSFTIGEIVRAAREAAELSEEQGSKEEARALETLTAEVIDVVEAPSVEKLEQMVGELSEQLNDRLGDLQEEQTANEERRQSDRQDDLTLTLFLWFLATYLAFFLWLLEQMPK